MLATFEVPLNTAITSAFGALTLYVAVVPLFVTSVAVTGTFTPSWHPVHGDVFDGVACAVDANAASRDAAASATTALDLSLRMVIDDYLLDCRMATCLGSSATVEKHGTSQRPSAMSRSSVGASSFFTQVRAL
jgi:hypothetical protein